MEFGVRDISTRKSKHKKSQRYKTHKSVKRIKFKNLSFSVLRTILKEVLFFQITDFGASRVRETYARIETERTSKIIVELFHPATKKDPLRHKKLVNRLANSQLTLHDFTLIDGQ